MEDDRERQIKTGRGTVHDNINGVLCVFAPELLSVFSGLFLSFRVGVRHHLFLFFFCIAVFLRRRRRFCIHLNANVVVHCFCVVFSPHFIFHP
jgi:hypothetical protein